MPRALQRSGMLAEFITDLWIQPGTFLHSWKKRLNGRFHPGLAAARVTSSNSAALRFELKASLEREKGWKLIAQRNEWFQQQAVDQLARAKTNGNHTVFAYSYAAAEIFEFARERGWRTVLGQIDPGPAEERIVAGLKDREWKRAPSAYWDNWRRECSLAHEIVVNSAWSRDALMSEGVAADKLRVIPVAYEASLKAKSFRRSYPNAFTSERPLRVLFLGQITLRKGVRELLDAVKLLAGEAVEFWFVGPTQMVVPEELRANARCRWFGVVPRVEVDRFYRDADLFILPTHSDGFGLTQLEAQSWKLPVIASRYCGEVVHDGVNGVVLDEVSGAAIAEVLRRLLREPDTLESMSRQSRVAEEFSLGSLASHLKRL